MSSLGLRSLNSSLSRVLLILLLLLLFSLLLLFFIIIIVNIVIIQSKCAMSKLKMLRPYTRGSVNRSPSIQEGVVRNPPIEDAAELPREHLRTQKR